MNRKQPRIIYVDRVPYNKINYDMELAQYELAVRMGIAWMFERSVKTDPIEKDKRNDEALAKILAQIK